ncbi:predicted protein [Naegleria gruberi]|uniref:Predicted protein n=1 Tax=Naegleria gruberi TaxID=5762 RepID=D2VLM0_NAEGR|nr:uncharacterized protein NAEGRDRAFT_69829 [Naegleria gruberi]EFC42414.1 predicted protein [Naegleria gruberi]|eukprot:XP_002675158.1 predicted protein [Naegleria gruberi strain NEG-M]
MQALVFDRFGEASQVLYMKELEKPQIGKNDVLVRTQAIGLNFADIYRRNGNYHLVGEPPYILGYEGAGIVEEIGSEVNSDLIRVGMRVGFADVPHANAQLVKVTVEKAIPLPDEISSEMAAAVLLQGLTAHYLTRDSFVVKEGTVAVVHAVAGGVGQLLTQIIKLLGGTVIGLTSSEEKAEIAKQIGADHVFLYKDNWTEQILQLTNQIGVNVVYESVGSTIMDSFKITKIGGTVVFYGMAGGDPPLINPRMLMDGSKTLTGGDLWNVLTSREERLKRSTELFSWISQKKITISEWKNFKLSEGALAHEFLEQRKSTGKILLIP